MPSFFCRKYTGEDTKKPLENQTLFIEDLTLTVETNSLDLGDYTQQEQTLTTSDTYSVTHVVDLATVFIKNTAPGSIGYLVVTGILPDSSTIITAQVAAAMGV